MSQLLQVPCTIGSINVILGCMFSGKSGMLIREANMVWRQKQSVKIFAPTMSIRKESERARLESHDGVVALCETVYLGVDDLFKTLCSDATQLPSVVCIDEAQFFKDLIKTCLYLRKNNITVLVAGLSLTSNRTPFGEMHALVDRADNFVQFKTVCHWCHRPGATLSFRTSDNKEEVFIGAGAEYVPSCQLCFDERYKSEK